MMIRICSILLALTFDLLLGDPPNRFHPVAAMGTYIRWTTSRAPEGGSTRRFLYGMMLTLGGMAIVILPMTALSLWIRPHRWFAIFINAILLKVVFSLRRLYESSREVQRTLEIGDLEAARYSVGWHLVGRNTTTLDHGHVASAVIESMSENLSDSVVAPMLAFIIGGLPLAWAYRFVNTTDSMIGYRDPQHEYLGKFAARMDDFLNLIPARLTGLILVLAAPICGGNLRQAWITMVNQHRRTASVNAGWPMGATAGALCVTLEKPGHYRLEGGLDLPTWRTINQACRLIIGASLIGLILLLAVGVAYQIAVNTSV